MSTLMTRLEKLTYFSDKHNSIQSRIADIQKEAQATDVEWTKWLETELKLEGNMHMAQVMKTVLETSYEAPRIIKP